MLEINNLTKKFGSILAVHNLSLSVEPGQVFGFLGPNGSGKTTTLAMILDVVVPTSGSFSWFGEKNKNSTRKNIGAILESPSFYPYMSAVDNLLVVAHIKGEGKKRISDVLRQVNLYERRHEKFRNYSLGMKQRLSLASALLVDPPVLILDEPTNGLDPQGITEVRDLIVKIANEGKTIILASHLLDEVQRFCTHFCVMKSGVKIYEGSINEIIHETNKVVLASDDDTDISVSLSGLPGILSINPDGSDGFILEISPEINAAYLNKACFEKGIVLKRIQTKKNTLEEEFLKILKENDKSN